MINDDQGLKTLVSIGFKEIEAQIYLALLKDERISAYSIALLIGHTRAQTYRAVEEMVKKGYLNVITGKVALYETIDIQQIGELQTTKDDEIVQDLFECLKELETVDSGIDRLLEITDYQEAMFEIEQFIQGAKKRVSIVASAKAYELINEQLSNIQKDIELFVVRPEFENEKLWIDELCIIEPSLFQIGDVDENLIVALMDKDAVLFGSIDDTHHMKVISTKNSPLIYILNEFIATFFTYRDFVSTQVENIN